MTEKPLFALFGRLVDEVWKSHEDDGKKENPHGDIKKH